MCLATLSRGCRKLNGTDKRNGIDESVGFESGLLQNVNLSHRAREEKPFPAAMAFDRLNISRNNISYVDRDAFEDLHELRILDLSSNSIDELSGGTFRTLEFLKYLNLGFNRLYKIHRNSFDGNGKLETLLLNDNFLSFDDNMLELPASVMYLNLINNNIRQLPFLNKTLDRLVVLDLNGNNLSTITNESFHNFRRLVILNLRNSSLVSVKEHAFVYNSLLEEVRLDGNQLNLDLGIEYIRA